MRRPSRRVQYPIELDLVALCVKSSPLAPSITSVVRYVSAPSSLVFTCGTWLRARTSLVLLARHTYTIVVLTFVYTLTIARG